MEYGGQLFEGLVVRRFLGDFGGEKFPERENQIKGDLEFFDEGGRLGGWGVGGWPMISRF